MITLLRPQENPCRERKELSCLWGYRFDWNEEGRSRGWHRGVEVEGELPVPASWNELFADDERKHFFGTCWYQLDTLVSKSWATENIWLRVGAVHYRATVWINGLEAGSYDGCHLPFGFAIEKRVRCGEMNRIVIAVNGRLDRDTIPPGNKNEGKTIFGIIPDATRPDVPFDFFPYCGIHRPVVLFTTPRDYIEDIAVQTDIRGTRGIVDAEVTISGENADTVECQIAGQRTKVRIVAPSVAVRIEIPGARLWAPGHPHLYPLTVQLFRDGQLLDQYTLNIGIRTIQVRGQKLLLNGRPIYLKGFGKHEDFPASGRGLNLAALKKDFELMKWTGANSFRTSHYPYAEEAIDLADREGFLVIAETAAVGIGFDYDMTAARKNHEAALTNLMIRDKNHPSVIMWSLANEPASEKPESAAYFKPLVRLARKLDPTRPLTIVSCDGAWVKRGKCHLMGLCDVIVINRYYGWYVGPGCLPEAMRALACELEEIGREYRRPVMLGEFGADCVAGLHSLPGMVFSEEYQSDLLEQTIRVLRTKKFVVGEHIWNFADFMTGQVHVRAVGNKKGIFTRDRQPKMAAHTVRRLWQDAGLTEHIVAEKKLPRAKRTGGKY